MWKRKSSIFLRCCFFLSVCHGRTLTCESPQTAWSNVTGTSVGVYCTVVSEITVSYLTANRTWAHCPFGLVVLFFSQKPPFPSEENERKHAIILMYSKCHFWFRCLYPLFKKTRLNVITCICDHYYFYICSRLTVGLNYVGCWPQGIALKETFDLWVKFFRVGYIRRLLGD